MTPARLADSGFPGRPGVVRSSRYWPASPPAVWPLVRGEPPSSAGGVDYLRPVHEGPDLDRVEGLQQPREMIGVRVGDDDQVEAPHSRAPEAGPRDRSRRALHQKGPCAARETGPGRRCPDLHREPAPPLGTANLSRRRTAPPSVGRPPRPDRRQPRSGGRREGERRSLRPPGAGRADGGPAATQGNDGRKATARQAAG